MRGAVGVDVTCWVDQNRCIEASVCGRERPFNGLLLKVCCGDAAGARIDDAVVNSLVKVISCCVAEPANGELA